MENFRALSVGGGMGGLLDQAIENGLVAPMVSVMPSAGRSFYEFQGRFAEMGRLRDEGSAALHAQELQRSTGSGGHVHHGHFDGRHGFAAHGGEVSGSL